MGCAGSKALPLQSGNDNASHIFKVTILDTKGHDGEAAKLEITASELLLHHAHRQSMCWPLSGVRHYGFNEDLFSFESGRRCPGGVHIYAFRCRRAEQLFNILQANVHRAAHERARQMETNRLAAVNHAMMLARFRANSTNGTAPLVTTSATKEEIAHDYLNTVHEYVNQKHYYENGINSVNNVCSAIQYAELDLPMMNHSESPDSIDADVDANLIGTLPNKPCVYVNIPQSIEGAAGTFVTDIAMMVEQADSCGNCTVGSPNIASTTLHPVCDPTGDNNLNSFVDVLSVERSQSCKIPSARSRFHRFGRSRTVSASGARAPSIRSGSTSSAGCYTTLDLMRTVALSERKLSLAAASDDSSHRRTRHSVTNSFL